MTAGNRIAAASGTYCVMVAAAVVVPPLAARGQEGLAAAGVAAFWFLVFGGLALVTSVFTLVLAVRAWRSLPIPLRAAGLLPALLSVIAIAALLLIMHPREARNRTATDTPGATTAPAAKPSPTAPLPERDIGR